MAPDPFNNQLGLRQTKMVCTIGPACRSPEKLAQLIQAGMDAARLHFAYGSQSEHAENIHRLREAARAQNRSIAITQDLSGTKIRMKAFAQEPVHLKEGAAFTLTARDVPGDGSLVSVSIPEILSVVQRGDIVLLADGALELEVRSTTDTEIHCRVVVGGEIKSQQAVHVPGKAPPVTVPTAKDRDDVRFGLKHQVDWIAQSYATQAEEITALRRFIQEQGAQTPIIAKVERRQALDHLDEIIRAADAVMIARGDLGMEVPIEQIGLVQKEITRRARALGKPVITATEMLASMMERPAPTRAEVSDITNAIIDGTDAVMLSGETAAGQYPIEAATAMARVARAADSLANEAAARNLPALAREEELAMALAHGACCTAARLGARLILCCTHTGRMARLISQHRPRARIVAASAAESVLRRTALLWGVQPLRLADASAAESSVAAAKEMVLAAGLAHRGDWAIILPGEPMPGKETNVMRTERL